MEERTSLGARLKALRTDRGMTQEQLADRLHVTRQAIAKWENDNGTPDVENLTRLADEFGVSLDRLVGREASADAKEAPSAQGEADAQESAKAENDSFPWKKNHPRWHLFSGVLLAIAALLWAFGSAIVYETHVVDDYLWALMLFCAAVNSGSAAVQFVKYYRRRNAS